MVNNRPLRLRHKRSLNELIDKLAKEIKFIDQPDEISPSEKELILRFRKLDNLKYDISEYVHIYHGIQQTKYKYYKK